MFVILAANLQYINLLALLINILWLNIELYPLIYTKFMFHDILVCTHKGTIINITGAAVWYVCVGKIIKDQTHMIVR
jgi:hypothetical protein